MNIEQKIKELTYLNPRQRAALRKQVADCISGVYEMPERGPAHIEPCDYAPLRRSVVQAAYVMECAGQMFDLKKATAFYNRGNGGAKPSVILPNKFL